MTREETRAERGGGESIQSRGRTEKQSRAFRAAQEALADQRRPYPDREASNLGGGDYRRRERENRERPLHLKSYPILSYPNKVRRDCAFVARHTLLPVMKVSPVRLLGRGGG